jgi:prevent-host-death family protein
MVSVPATEFRAKCLHLMEQVRQTGVPLVITKRGAQLVRVVPVIGDEAPPGLKGTILFQAGDLTTTGETWEAEST